MNLQDDPRWFRFLLLVLVASVLFPSTTMAQGYTFYRCVSPDSVPSRVLNAPFSITLWKDPAKQTIQTCANFCFYGTIPPEADPRGNRALFKEPYTFSMLRGNECFCGNNVNAPEVAPSQCTQQQPCLNSPTNQCPLTRREGLMVFTMATGGGAQGGGQAGGRVGAGAKPPPPPPPPTSGNRPPNPPTVSPGGYDPPFPTQYEGAIQLTWRNNGDPDGDALTFGVFIMQYDFPVGAWVPVPSFRDQYGNTGAAWTSETVYTFTTQNGLRAGNYYAWTVIACEVGRSPTQQCAWGGWSVFRTS